MNTMLLLIAAYLMGCIAAIPAGPVQIEVIRRSINGHLLASFMVIFGAFCIDAAYGIIALFGIAPFLESKVVMAIFWLIGGLILIILGSLGIYHSIKGGTLNLETSYLGKKRWAFAGGISLAAMNPVMILWWLTSARLFGEIGLIKALTPEVALLFLLAGSLGLASYLIVLSLFINWAKRFISESMVSKINIAFSILLLLLAGYFVTTSLKTLIRLYL
jgi:threonine/homoserine/homoserine lactone efflux protein